MVKSFGSKRVADGISLRARAGEAVAIVGENGAGNSTLLRICAASSAPTLALWQPARWGSCPQEPAHSTC